MLGCQSRQLDCNKFGPCPNCREWLRLSVIDWHQKLCSRVANQSFMESKGVLLVESAVLAGRIHNKADQALVSEVFPHMRNDDISRVIQSEPLIITAGN